MMKIGQIIVALMIVCLTMDCENVFSKQNAKSELTFHTMTIKPKIAAPNDTVQVVVIYELSGVDGPNLGVTERKSLRFGGDEVSLLEKKETSRTNGQWMIETTFLIPASAALGEYEILQVVFSKYFSKSLKGSFTVASTNQTDAERLAKATAYTQKLKEEIEAEIKADERALQEKRAAKEKELSDSKQESEKSRTESKTVESSKDLSTFASSTPHALSKEGVPKDARSSDLAEPSHPSDKLKINAGVTIEEVKESKKAGQKQIEVAKATTEQLPSAERKDKTSQSSMPEESKVSTVGQKVPDNMQLLPDRQPAVEGLATDSPPSIANQEKQPVKTDVVAEVDNGAGRVMQNEVVQSKPDRQPAPVKLELPVIEKKIGEANLVQQTSPDEQSPTTKKNTLEDEQDWMVPERWEDNRDLIDPRVHKLAKREKLNNGSQGPWLVALPLGTFSMGGRNFSEKPIHYVEIENQFSIMVHEVTVGMYQQYKKNVYGSQIGDVQPWQKNLPVTNVSWKEAKGFARWLSKTSGHTYRLPTEAEWEYAAKYCRDKTQPVSPASFQVMPGQPEVQDGSNLGVQVVFNSSVDRCKLYGIRGNVWEWTEDCWSERYPPNHTVQEAYSPADCANRVIRGGSYMEDEEKQTETIRVGVDPNARVSDIGFRLVREEPL